MRSATYRKGFTLVELLVVIGIIAVLIGILLPAMARVRALANSSVCQSNLRQVGQAIFIYANQNRGQLPIGNIQSLEQFPQTSRDALLSILRIPYQATSTDPIVLPTTGVNIFFCPVNQIRTWTPDDFVSFTSEGKMRYWYVANPYQPSYSAGGFGPFANPDTSASLQWYDFSLDTPGAYAGVNSESVAYANGTSTIMSATRGGVPATPQSKAGREYIRTTSDKHASEIIIMTDQSKQAQAAGGWYAIHGVADAFSKQKGNWKNNLYGDGHVSSLRPDEMKVRWGRGNAAAW